MPRRTFAGTFHPATDLPFSEIARLMKVILISHECRFAMVPKSREMKDVEGLASATGTQKKDRSFWFQFGTLKPPHRNTETVFSSVGSRANNIPFRKN
jgi:hypothetical protein